MSTSRKDLDLHLNSKPKKDTGTKFRHLMLLAILFSAASAPAIAAGAADPATAPATSPSVKYLTVAEMLQAVAKHSELTGDRNLTPEQLELVLNRRSELYARMADIHFKPNPADEPALLAAMTDPKLDFTAQLCVTGYLLDLNNESAHKFLLPLLDGSDPKAIQESAFALLLHLHPEDPHDWATAQIIRSIANDHLMLATDNNRVYLYIAVLKIKSAEPELIAALMRHPNHESLAQAVAAFDDDAASAACVATLESPNGRTLNFAQAAYLARHNHPGIAPVLLFLGGQLSDAARLLDFLDDKSVLPALRDYVQKNPKPEDKAAFIRIAIVRLESPDRQTMIARLGQMLDDTGDTSILAPLGDTKDPAAIPPIVRLIKRSGDAGGVVALETIGGPQAIHTLVDLLDLNITSAKYGTPGSPFRLNDSIFKSLENMTGQNFGPDEQKWHDYVDNIAPIENGNPTTQPK